MLSYERDKILVVDGVRLIYGLACDEIFGFVAGGEMALARWHRYGELTTEVGQPRNTAHVCCFLEGEWVERDFFRLSCVQAYSIYIFYFGCEIYLEKIYFTYLWFDSFTRCLSKV